MGKLDDVLRDNPMFFSLLRGAMLGLTTATVAWDKLMAGDPMVVGAVVMAMLTGMLRAGDRNPV
jgi:hypothetical protein